MSLLGQHLTPSDKGYNPHFSPYSILSHKGIMESAAMDTTMSANGFMSLEDVFGTTHHIQMVHKTSMDKLHVCDRLEIMFRYSGCVVFNTYERVFCEAIDDFLPLWELVKSSRSVGPITTYRWTLQDDKDWYKAATKLLAKQRAIEAEMAKVDTPTQEMLEAAADTQAKLDSIDTKATVIY